MIEKIHIPKNGVVCYEDCDRLIERASGLATCQECGLIYYEHPYCLGTRIPGVTEYSDEYYCVVACDGRHLHL